MPGAYLPLIPAVRDRVNESLAAYAARGFVPDIASVVRSATIEQAKEDTACAR